MNYYYYAHNSIRQLAVTNYSQQTGTGKLRAVSSEEQSKYVQESCAIAKMTAQCALHYGCPENFRDSLTTPTVTIPNIYMGFCSDRPYECSYSYKI